MERFWRHGASENQSRKPPRSHAQCHACHRRYALADAAVVAEIPIEEGFAKANVVLLDPGPDPERVARQSSYHLGAPLPMVVVGDVSHPTAESAGKSFEAIGAKVDVVPSNPDRDPRWDNTPRAKLVD
jgi:hypothetical protein